MTVINIEIPSIIPRTDIFDIILIKLLLSLDLINLYASNKYIYLLYHSELVERIIMRNQIISEEHSNTIILKWPSMHKNKDNWLDLLNLYIEIISFLLEKRVCVILAENLKSNFIDDILSINKKIDFDLNSIITLKINTNDIWIRDYGPFMLLDNITNKYFILDYNYNAYGEKYSYDKDNEFTHYFFKYLNKNNYKIFTKRIFNKIFIEGGNIIYNKFTYILNKNCLQNTNKKFSWSEIKEELDYGFNDNNLSPYFVLDIENIAGDDTNGHIDNLVRLYKDNLLYMSCKDIEHPDYYILKELENQIKLMVKKMPFIKNIIEIEHNANDIIYYNNKILPFSYLNFINVANNVLIPIHSNTKNKTITKLKGLFNKSSIKFINSNSLLRELGGLHCCSLNWKL